MKNKVSILIKRLKINQVGGFAIEYALLLPIFITLLFGSMEIGRIMMVYTALEGAVTESSRIAITGQVPAGFATNEDYIKDFVQNSLRKVAGNSTVTTQLNVYDSFASVGQPEPYTDTNGNSAYDSGECYTDINNNNSWDNDMGADGTGAGENIMVMNINVDLPYVTGRLMGKITGKNSIVLSTSTAVRNEPFGGVAWTPSSNVICV